MTTFFPQIDYQHTVDDDVVRVSPELYHNLWYEGYMLKNVAERLQNLEGNDWVLRSAFLECCLIHLRNLVSFVRGENRFDTDVTARGLKFEIDRVNQARARLSEPLTLDGNRPVLPFCAQGHEDSWLRRFHRQMCHLTTERHGNLVPANQANKVHGGDIPHFIRRVEEAFVLLLSDLPRFIKSEDVPGVMVELFRPAQ